MRDQISEMLKASFASYLEEPSQKTVFAALLESGLPSAELTLTRLQHDAISLVGARIETTKRALSLGSYHILNNPAILARLREEWFQRFRIQKSRLHWTCWRSYRNSVRASKKVYSALPFQSHLYLHICLPTIKNFIHSFFSFFSFFFSFTYTTLRLPYGTSQRTPRLSSQPVSYGSLHSPSRNRHFYVQHLRLPRQSALP